MADVIPFDQRDGALWYDGKLVPWSDAKTHVLTHGLHYASCVFEGERIYDGRIYKLKEHTARLFESARILGMKIPFTQDEINRRCIEAADGAGHQGWLYPPRRLPRQRDDGGLGAEHQDPCRHRRWPWPSYFDPAEKLKGIRLDISRLAPSRARHRADACQGGRPLHDLHHVQARGGSAGLCRRADVRLSRLCRGSDRRQYLLRQGRRAAHADRRTASSTASRASR